MSLSPRPRADPWQMKQPNSDVNPALIALVSVIALAFLIVTYYNLLKCCCCYCKPMLLWPWRTSRADQMVVVVQDSDALNLVSPGLDYWVMKMLPVFKFMQVRQNLQGQDTECSVCLLDFQDQDEIRILPKCRHVFHLQCIDMWLTSHASCPLCRSNLVGFEDLHNSSSGTRSRSSHIILVAQEASMEANSNTEADSISAELEIVSKEQQQQVVDSSPALNQIQDQNQHGADAVAGTSVLNGDVVLELVNSDDDEGVGEDLQSLR